MYEVFYEHARVAIMEYDFSYIHGINKLIQYLIDEINFPLNYILITKKNDENS